MNRQSSHPLSAAVVSTVSLLFGASAQAGHYPGASDPGGDGNTIPGFTGEYVFTIDDNCFSSPGFHNVNVCGSCSFASVYSGNVNLYSTATDTPPNGSVLGTFDLTTNPHDFWPIFDVFINDDLTLGGIDTGSMGGNGPFGGNPGTGFYMGTDFWLLITCGGLCDDPAYISVNGDTFGPPGEMTFGPACADPDNCHVATTPEPGSLGLLFAALGGGWLARRRARKDAEI